MVTVSLIAVVSMILAVIEVVQEPQRARVHKMAVWIEMSLARSHGTEHFRPKKSHIRLGLRYKIKIQQGLIRIESTSTACNVYHEKWSCSNGQTAVVYNELQ